MAAVGGLRAEGGTQGAGEGGDTVSWNTVSLRVGCAATWLGEHQAWNARQPQVAGRGQLSGRGSRTAPPCPRGGPGCPVCSRPGPLSPGTPLLSCQRLSAGVAGAECGRQSRASGQRLGPESAPGAPGEGPGPSRHLQGPRLLGPAVTAYESKPHKAHISQALGLRSAPSNPSVPLLWPRNPFLEALSRLWGPPRGAEWAGAKRKMEKASRHLLACVSLHLGPWAVPRDLGSERVTHCGAEIGPAVGGGEGRPEADAPTNRDLATTAAGLPGPQQGTAPRGRRCLPGARPPPAGAWHVRSGGQEALCQGLGRAPQGHDLWTSRGPLPLRGLELEAGHWPDVARAREGQRRPRLAPLSIGHGAWGAGAGAGLYRRPPGCAPAGPARLAGQRPPGSRPPHAGTACRPGPGSAPSAGSPSRAGGSLAPTPRLRGAQAGCTRGPGARPPSAGPQLPSSDASVRDGRRALRQAGAEAEGGRSGTRGRRQEAGRGPPPPPRTPLHPSASLLPASHVPPPEVTGEPPPAPAPAPLGPAWLTSLPAQLQHVALQPPAPQPLGGLPAHRHRAVTHVLHRQPQRGAGHI